MSSDYITVLDCGSGFVRAGFAGEDAPRLHFPNLINKALPVKKSAAHASSASNPLPFKAHQKQVQSMIPTQATESVAPAPHEKSFSISDPLAPPQTNPQHAAIVRDKMIGWNGISQEYWENPAKSLTLPIEDGKITDMEGLKQIWKYISEHPKMEKAMKEQPILITEPIYDNIETESRRCEIAKYFFETMQHSAIYFAQQTVLDVFSTGKTTALVIDIGHHLTQIVPVFEGFHLTHAHLKNSLGGRDVSFYLEELLKTRMSGKSAFSNSAKEKVLRFGGAGGSNEKSSLYREARTLPFGTIQCLDIIAKVKESLCGVALDPSTIGASTGATKKEFILPDKTILTVGGTEMQKAPEILFNPSLLNGISPKTNMDGVQTSIMKVLKKLEIDEYIHDAMKNNMLLAGGSTMFDGMRDRLSKELSTLLGIGPVNIAPSLSGSFHLQPQQLTASQQQQNNLVSSINNIVQTAGGLNSSFTVPHRPSSRSTSPTHINKHGGYFDSLSIEAPSERNMSSWVGGSMLASLGSFAGSWITKNDYMEKGENVVFEKNI